MAEEKYSHKKFGVCKIEPITQGVLEKYMTKLQPFEGKPMTVFHGAAVRIAFEVGMMTSPEATPDFVDKASPGLIKWLSVCLADAVQEATTLNPL